MLYYFYVPNSIYCQPIFSSLWCCVPVKGMGEYILGIARLPQRFIEYSIVVVLVEGSVECLLAPRYLQKPAKCLVVNHPHTNYRHHQRCQKTNPAKTISTKNPTYAQFFSKQKVPATLFMLLGQRYGGVLSITVNGSFANINYMVLLK